MSRRCRRQSMAWLLCAVRSITEPSGMTGYQAQMAATSVAVFPVPGGPWIHDIQCLVVVVMAVVCGELRCACRAACVICSSVGA